MKKGMSFFDKTFRRDIYQNMIDEQKKQTLPETLIKMQTDKGISQQEAAATANLCITAVTSCESVRSAVADAPESTVEELLAEVGSDDELALHKLYFGITLYRQHVASDEQVSSDELFWRYYTKNKGTKSVEVLKEDIRNALKDYRLNPETIQALTKKMGASGDYLAVATALGEGGISFKCITAMEVYLNNRDTMTIHEAANIACTAVEVQAAGDAVGRGLITRDAAKKILIIAGITLALVGLGIMLYHGGAAAALAKAAANAPASLVCMPEVFGEFATYVTSTGMPVTQAVPTDWIRAGFTPLIKAAEHKQMLGGIVAVLGAAGVALSGKTANLIGKFRVGFTNDKERVCEGLRNVAEHTQLQTVAETEHQTVPEELPEQQPRFAKLGAP